jgi:hypothetical protein
MSAHYAAATAAFRLNITFAVGVVGTVFSFSMVSGLDLLVLEVCRGVRLLGRETADVDGFLARGVAAEDKTMELRGDAVLEAIDDLDDERAIDVGDLIDGMLDTEPTESRRADGGGLMSDSLKRAFFVVTLHC